jgi:hypothetical protein
MSKKQGRGWYKFQAQMIICNEKLLLSLWSLIIEKLNEIRILNYSAW